MAVTIDEARKVVMEPKWVAAWVAEADRRHARMESGEDRELTLEEFWADDEET